MTNIPATFLGTILSTIAATACVIFNDNNFHLWSPLARWLIMGGASLVLLTYSISWFFLESFEEKAPNGKQINRGEYWIRITTQTMLGLALGALGADLGLYFGLFVTFIVLNFVSIYMASRAHRSVTVHEGVNALLCCVYTYLAFILYIEAVKFEKFYPAMSEHRPSLDVSLHQYRGELADKQMILGFVVGVLLMNLLALLVSNPWIRNSRLFSGASTTREQQ